MNNSHHQKALAKQNKPKYIKPLTVVHTSAEPVKFYLKLDEVIFSGTLRLVRM
jgi:hypothetical protein